MPKTSAAHKVALQRARRTRAKLATNKELPRLSVHRTLRHMYAQIIDDNAGRTLAATSDLALKLDGTKTEVAAQIGAEIAKLALAKKVTAVRFDRGMRMYHGRVAALAEAARENGLTF
jgi:large subunit ribosomal protein L18